MKLELLNKITERSAKVGIIGLGYVGLPLAIRFSEERFQVVGFDIDVKKASILNAGNSFIKHIEKEKISAMVEAGFIATDDFGKISDIDIILICVPTPLGYHNEPDLSYIRQTLKSITPCLKEKQLLVLESTTYPGTTDEEIVPLKVEASVQFHIIDPFLDIQTELINL